MCMLFVAVGRSLLTFSDVPFKMAPWWSYWIILFLDSNFNLTLNIKSKLEQYVTAVHGLKFSGF